MNRTMTAAATLLLITGCSGSDRAPVTELQDKGTAHREEPENLDVAGLIATVNSATGEGWLSVHPENTLAVFSRQIGGFGDQRIFVTERRGDTWTPPVMAPFAADLNERGARFAPDGRRVVFASTRPESDSDEVNDWNIWSVDIDDAGHWGDPEPVSGVNSTANDFHPSVTNEGAIYFGSPRAGGLGRSDMYVGKPGAEGWTVEPAASLNSELSEPDPFIAPDGSYMIFARTGAPGGFGGDDLYVAFSSAHGWSEPQNLGVAVNTPEYEYGAFVTADGKTLLYTTWASGIPQVAAIALSELKLSQ